MEFFFAVIGVFLALRFAPAALVEPTSRPFLALAVGMILTGVEHILHEDGYAQIMQDWIPNKSVVIRISVAIRILAGVALMFHNTRRAAASVCLVLFLIVLPVNLRVAFSGDAIPGLAMPVWRRWMRLALHLGWLGWCFWCTRLGPGA